MLTQVSNFTDVVAPSDTKWFEPENGRSDGHKLLVSKYHYTIRLSRNYYSLRVNGAKIEGVGELF